MRRISRLSRSIDQIRVQPFTKSPYSYTCLACRQHAAFTTSLPRAAIADRIKGKLWKKGQTPEEVQSSAASEEEADILGNEKARRERLNQVKDWAEKEGIKTDGLQSTVDSDEQMEDGYDGQPKAFTNIHDAPGDYAPAESWKGLEMVGGPVKDWNEEWSYRGFMPATQPMNNDQITAALHRAIVEVYTFRQAGKKLEIPSNPLTEEELMDDITTEVQFVATKSGAKLKYTKEQTMEKIMESLGPQTEDEPVQEIVQTEKSSDEVVGEEPKEKLKEKSTIKYKQARKHQKIIQTEKSSDEVVGEEPKEKLEEKSTIKYKQTRKHQKNMESRKLKAKDKPVQEIVQTEKSSDEVVGEESKEVVGEESKVELEEESTIEYKQARQYLESYNKDLIASWGPTWLQVSVQDPQVKFAVIKRVFQLTGIRVPDPEISSITDVKSLLTRLITPPKPTTLFDALEQKGDFHELPNIGYKDRRVTPVDREMSVGRWKLIKEELSRRNLPILKNGRARPAMGAYY